MSQDPETQRGSAAIASWPEESREAALIVIDTYGQPTEATPTQLVWHGAGEWKRIVATREFHQHDFPAPHIDCVETFLAYRVPPERLTDLGRFDGSVMVDRTAGEISARCHDERANCLALNLAHDIVTGGKTPEEARQYYATEFLDARRGLPTPYMDRLRFQPDRGGAGDPDRRLLSDADLDRAEQEGEGSS